MLEVIKKRNWIENDIDKIYHSSIESFAVEWLNDLKKYIEENYNVNIMTLVYDKKCELIHVIFYGFDDLLLFYKTAKINFGQSPTDLNKRASELSNNIKTKCKICPLTFTPYARDCLFKSLLKNYKAELFDSFLCFKPSLIFFDNYYVIIFETQEQAIEFLRSDHRRQMHKKIFEIAKTMDEYGVVKESDVYVLADHQAHFDQMEGHYHQWLEELNFDEMNNYENSLSSF
jgi:hypothetical protein